MTPRAGGGRDITPGGRVIDALLAPVVIAIAVITFALYVTRARWDRLAVWGVQLSLVIIPVVLANHRVISAIECVALELLVLASMPLARRLAVRLEPLALARERARWAREDLAFERKRLAARAALEQELAIPRRVLAVPNGFVVVEGGYILDPTTVAPPPDSVRPRFTSELTRAIAGRQITARLVDDFMQLYVPNGCNAGLEKFRGPGRRYGMVPVNLVVDGRVLAWKDSGFELVESTIAPKGDSAGNANGGG